jgi:ATP-binding cassette ChvD family protein
MATDKEANKVIYSMMRVGKLHGTKKVLENISLSYFYGAKIGVLGLNGSGKSSLLRIMAGVDQDFLGETAISPGHTIGFLPQEPELEPGTTVLEVVKEGVTEVAELLREFEEINARFAEPMSDDEMEKLLARQGEVQDRLDALDAWNLDSRLQLALDALRCPPPDTPVDVLSGGERRRVALCRLLLQEPDILLLDEPTNHLDAPTVQWLEQHLHRYAGTVIAVTHDRYFLDNVAEWILELDRGRGIPWKGNYSSWLEQKQERLSREEKAESERQRTLQRELEWIHQSPRARRAKSKARITAFEELASQNPERLAHELEIYIPPGRRLGDLVVEAAGVRKAYGDRVLLDDASFTVPRGAVVGLIGPNGAGKTTLFRMIVGQELPDAGTIRLGETVEVGYVDQSRSSLDPGKSVWDVISGGADQIALGKVMVNSRAYVGRFNFTGYDQQKPVETLSGGERNRVHLAQVLKLGANLLLLDEPTNDLDVNTMRALEDALLEFVGCVMVISHDRWFLDRVATHLLVFEGDGRVEWFEGNFTEYAEAYKARTGEDVAQLKSSRYRSLTRG